MLYLAQKRNTPIIIIMLIRRFQSLLNPYLSNKNNNFYWLRKMAPYGVPIYGF